MFSNIWQCKHFKPSESLIPKFILIVDSRKVDSRKFETILSRGRDPGPFASPRPLDWSDLLVGFGSYGGKGVRCVGG